MNSSPVTPAAAGTLAHPLRPPLWWLGLFIGGLLFLGAFALRYQTVPPIDYTERDDGIITMSHARNLVEYGFLGVNPSGGRVEAYSAPVQMVVYAALYAATGLSYATYGQLQTLLATFLLGVLFCSFFTGTLAWRLAATALGALLLLMDASFLEWHGSGMENPLTHVLFLATLAVLWGAIRNGRIAWWTLLVPLLASLSRLDSILYIAPLLAVFAIGWFVLRRSFAAIAYGGLGLAGWVAVQGLRYYYFGSLQPNTAGAQGIDVASRLLHLHDSLTATFSLSWAIFRTHGFLWLLLALPLALFRQERRLQLTFGAVLAAGIAVTWLQPLLFGPARLDEMRTTTHLTVFTALAVALLVFQPGRLKVLAFAAPLLLVGAGLAYHKRTYQPYYLCCHTTFFDDVREGFAAAATQEKIPRPLVANPDLGVMSWHKQFNVLDLGRLGSPILATSTDPAVQAEYLFEYAAPDLIESHSWWSCDYNRTLFGDERFLQRYQPVRAVVNDGPCISSDQAMLRGMWIRKDMLAGSASAERRLVDALTAQPSTQQLASEWRSCRAAHPGQCLYVLRSAYRFLPELRRAGGLAALREEFERSEYRRYARDLLSADSEASTYKAAIANVRDLLAQPAGAAQRPPPPKIAADDRLMRSLEPAAVR